MKTFRLYGRYDLRLHVEPIPLPAEGQELLQIASVGICGSDLLWYSTAGIGDAQLTHNLVLGHEFVAITEKGQRVAVDPAIPCGKCPLCLSGDANLCPAVIFAGHDSHDGALREWLVWPSSNLHPLPDQISNAEGVMLEPLGVAIHAVDLAHLRIGMRVGVVGCGPIGLLIIQLARLAGSGTIIATDPLQHRVDAAKVAGADQAVLIHETTDLSSLFAYTDGEGVDVAFDASGSPDAVNTAFQMAVPGGKVILAGIPDNDHTEFSASLARRKGLTIKLVRRMKLTYPRAIDLVLQKKINVSSIISHHFPFEQTPQAFELAGKRNGLKIIIDLLEG